ncbi:hypothetical protein [Aliamphritea spongicola]|uniref:hypothetical protein n=1 Tax=Aliamphritea spongicola TaxID=707589 RepID=UPI00196B3103|nr:hypothetical protein [Aliamphritea spongicola]MBN3561421.1 hypothetical protein [Aliamphritea spongicola]
MSVCEGNTEFAADIQKACESGEDAYGNQISHVFVKRQLFMVYQIDDADINNSLRVYISENPRSQDIDKRYSYIRHLYFNAKGLLARSPNLNAMKYRIAKTVEDCLKNDALDKETAEQTFKHLIHIIEEEYAKATKNRFYYLLPHFVTVPVLFLVCLQLMDQRSPDNEWWVIFTSFLAAALGGFMSVLKNASTLNFYEYSQKRKYVFLGAERLLLSFVAAAIAFIVLKSGAVVALTGFDSYWQVMLVLVVAGFSETLVPGILQKMEKRVSLEGKSQK